MMQLFKKLKGKEKPDNNGSVLVTVLIMFMFVSVLISIILTSSAVNFQIRAMDRQTTNEFYYAEKALNKIYSNIGKKTSEMTGKLYNDVLTFNVDDSDPDDKKAGYISETEQETIRRFNEQYLAKLEALFVDKSSQIEMPVKESMKYAPGVADKVYLCNKTELSGYIDGSNAKITSTPWIAYRYEESVVRDEKNARVVVTEADFPYRTMEKNSPSYDRLRAIIIKDLTIESNNPDTGFVSSITTDIVIGTPMVEFVTVNKQNLDYAIIANKGIVFNGGTESNPVEVDIVGNVYGGSTASNPGTDGININDYSKVTINSRYVLSGGDINVNNNGSLVINNGASECDVWYENMTVNSKNNNAVDVNASVYALDDLTVNGDGAGVVFKGNYFGYNDGLCGVAETDKPTADKSKASSLIVNAKNATVDMKDIDIFVMLGNAYINHESKQPRLKLDSGAADNKYIPTNESVSIKAFQEVYLVPTEFLDSENPMVTDVRKPFNVNIPDEWFGTKYLDETEKYKVVYLKKGSKYVAYCYLNFKDDAMDVAESDMSIVDVETGEIVNIKAGQAININRKKYVNKIFPHAEFDMNDKIVVPDDVAYPSLEEKEGDTDEEKARKAEKKEKNGPAPSPKDIYERIMQLYELQKSNIYIGIESELVPGALDRINENGISVYSPYGIAQNSKLTQKDNPDKYDGYTVTLKSSTKGIERFSGYKENLYRKYVWFDTYLDPQEEHAVTNVGTAQNRAFPIASSSDVGNEDLPLARLINFRSDGIAGLSPSVLIKDEDANIFPHSDVYIVNGNYELRENLSGFLIVNGDVTIGNGFNIDGFVYATGTVTFEGSSQVHFSSTLLERRIDDEIKKVKEDYGNGIKEQNEAYKNYYLISYLLKNPVPKSDKHNPDSECAPLYWSNNKKYDYHSDNETEKYGDINTDYRNFITYENWVYGQTK